MECKKEDNLKRCKCTWAPCERKGVCCECLIYHWKRRELPACFFPPDIESTYDRSLSTFLSLQKKS